MSHSLSGDRHPITGEQYILTLSEVLRILAINSVAAVEAGKEANVEFLGMAVEHALRRVAGDVMAIAMKRMSAEQRQAAILDIMLYMMSVEEKQ